MMLLLNVKANFVKDFCGNSDSTQTMFLSVATVSVGFACMLTSRVTLPGMLTVTTTVIVSDEVLSAEDGATTDEEGATEP